MIFLDGYRFISCFVEYKLMVEEINIKNSKNKTVSNKSINKNLKNSKV